MEAGVIGLSGRNALYHAGMEHKKEAASVINPGRSMVGKIARELLWKQGRASYAIALVRYIVPYVNHMLFIITIVQLIVCGRTGQCGVTAVCHVEVDTSNVTGGSSWSNMEACHAWDHKTRTELATHITAQVSISDVSSISAWY